MQTVSEGAGKEELLMAIEEAESGLGDLVSRLDEAEINSIPYSGSWTAGQLVRHVTKSTAGMTKAMGMKAPPAQRNAGERITQLKEIFLNFSTKMQSPAMIVPEEQLYEKGAVLKELTTCFQQFRKEVAGTDLSGLVEGLPLGPITKLEMLHFVVYHTQRHLDQLQRISKALKNK